jgi:hypothetical protein
MSARSLDSIERLVELSTIAAVLVAQSAEAARLTREQDRSTIAFLPHRIGQDADALCFEFLS